MALKKILWFCSFHQLNIILLLQRKNKTNFPFSRILFSKSINIAKATKPKSWSDALAMVF